MNWLTLFHSGVRDANSLGLAAALHGRLVSTAGTGNLAFSPWSVSLALATLHAGASGETRSEIEGVLAVRFS